MPVYNKQKYIKEILANLKDQSLTDFECIIIDDGSTDDSGKICDDFAGNDNRFQVYHIKNCGVSHARNLGIAHAQSELITFVDADDRVDEEYLSSLYNAASESGADMVIAAIKKIWNDSDNYKIVPTPYIGIKNINDILPDFAAQQLHNGIYGFCTAKIIRKSQLRNIAFDESLTLAEDFDFYLKIYSKINTIYFLNEPHYLYLQMQENSSETVCDSDIQYESQLRIYIHYKNFLKEKDAFNNENKKIVEQRLSDYTFFSLFYCKRNELNRTFKYLRSVFLKENYLLTGVGALQKILLFTFRHNLYLFTKIILHTYDALRKVKYKLWKTN